MIIARSIVAGLATALAIAGLMSPAAAELPPQYTVWADFAAVVGQSSIPQQLGVVDSIERTSDGQYIVRAGACFVTVTVIRKFSEKKFFVGPSHIARVEVSEKHCKQ